MLRNSPQWLPVAVYFGFHHHMLSHGMNVPPGKSTLRLNNEWCYWGAIPNNTTLNIFVLVSWHKCSTWVDNYKLNSRVVVLIDNLTSPEWGLLLSIVVRTLGVCSWGWELRQQHCWPVPRCDYIWPTTIAQLCSLTLVMVMLSLAAWRSLWLEVFSGICCELRQFNNMWQDTRMMIARVTIQKSSQCCGSVGLEEQVEVSRSVEQTLCWVTAEGTLGSS